MKPLNPLDDLRPGSGSVHLYLVLGLIAVLNGAFGSDRTIDVELYGLPLVFPLKPASFAFGALIVCYWLGYRFLERRVYPLNPGWLRLHTLGLGLLPVGLLLLDRGTRDPLLYFSEQGQLLSRLGRVVSLCGAAAQLLFPAQLIRCLVLARRNKD